MSLSEETVREGNDGADWVLFLVTTGRELFTPLLPLLPWPAASSLSFAQSRLFPDSSLSLCLFCFLPRRRLRGGSSRGPARPADRGEKQVDSSHSAQPLPRMGGSDLLRVLEPPSTSEHRGLRKKLSAMLLGSPSRKGKEREVDGYDEGAGESSLRGGSRGALMGLLM